MRWRSDLQRTGPIRHLFRQTFLAKKIEEITVFFGDKNSVNVVPRRPLVIVSRKELGQSCWKRPHAAGFESFTIASRSCNSIRIAGG